MGKKKKNDPSAAPPPPPMFVGDDRSGTARMPEPPAPPLPSSPHEVGRGRFEHSSSASPRSPERYSGSPSMAEGLNKALGCLAFVALFVAGAFAEAAFPLSSQRKILGGIGFFAVVGLLQLWMSLHDADLACSDRDSKRWMARLRHRLRQILNIPII